MPRWGFKTFYKRSYLFIINMCKGFMFFIKGSNIFKSFKHHNLMAKGNDFFTMGSTKSSSIDQPHHCSRSIVCVGSRPNPPRETKTTQEGFPRSSIPSFVCSKRLFTSSNCKRGSIDLQKGLKSFSMVSLPSIGRSGIYQQDYGLHDSTISKGSMTPSCCKYFP